MKATLTFLIEVPNVQKAAALRDKLAGQLREDEVVTVINEGMARNTKPFKVIGVDTASKQPFEEQVEATDADDAEVQAVGKSKTKVVASVTDVLP